MFVKYCSYISIFLYIQSQRLSIVTLKSYFGFLVVYVCVWMSHVTWIPCQQDVNNCMNTLFNVSIIKNRN